MTLDTATAVAIPEETQQELEYLRDQLSVAPNSTITTVLHNAISCILDLPKPGAGYDLEAVERLIDTATVWLRLRRFVPSASAMLDQNGQ